MAVLAMFASYDPDAVKLADEDIKTREVLDWKGLHVFHFIFSSCSQKLRIFLSLKGIDYESHEVDLMTNENLSDYFLGINPRGLLPVIVHDGDVHIESNDILTYLESVYPEPRLIPEGAEDKVAALLKHEDDLHLDLRALSFRFVFNPPHDPKSPEDLEIYATTGSGTVNGQKDERVGVEIDFWETYADRGITDDVAQAAAESSARSSANWTRLWRTRNTCSRTASACWISAAGGDCVGSFAPAPSARTSPP